MSNLILDSVVIPSVLPPEHSIIWLHGLGADGHDFLDIVPQLNLPEQLSKKLRFVFPHAPMRSVTVNGGASMRAWYDIYGFERGSFEDVPGILGMHTLIEALIAEEVRQHVPNKQIVLAGFSQGGAMALYSGLHHSHRLAGILALSTYLPIAAELRPVHKTAKERPPIFMAHGLEDSILPVTMGENSRRHLEKLGYSVDWHDYSMGHQVCPAEIKDISDWLTCIFAQNQ